MPACSCDYQDARLSEPRNCAGLVVGPDVASAGQVIQTVKAPVVTANVAQYLVEARSVEQTDTGPSSGILCGPQWHVHERGDARGHPITAVDMLH